MELVTAPKPLSLGPGDFFDILQSNFLRCPGYGLARGISHAPGRASRRIQMSKHPSPRVDQLRAMREAKFARNEQRQQEDAKSATPAKTKSKAKKKIER